MIMFLPGGQDPVEVGFFHWWAFGFVNMIKIGWR